MLNTKILAVGSRFNHEIAALHFVPLAKTGRGEIAAVAILKQVQDRRSLAKT